MSLNYKSLFAFFFLLLFSVTLSAHTLDSLRLEKIKGKKFIIHRVDPKETLYSISKRYHSSIDEIYAYNPQIEDGLKMFDELKIPFNKVKKEKNTVAATPPAIESTKTSSEYVIVEAGQTLYAISKSTGIGVDSLRSINHLSSNYISIGDTLYTAQQKQTELTVSDNIDPNNYHSVQAGETVFFIATKYGLSVEQVVELNDLESYNLEINQKLRIKSDSLPISEIVTITLDSVPSNDDIPTIDVLEEEDISLDTVYVKTDNNSIHTVSDEVNGETIITQEGFAMEIEDTDYTSKLLALHKTAPLGSLVSITNQMNGKKINVRVVGKLPESGLNKNIVMRLSHSAFETLGALDYKIPVTSQYATE
ncbi:MAG: LysM peptidoglycan-binding domain-containing protein [Reichenbachiella sp.]